LVHTQQPGNLVVHGLVDHERHDRRHGHRSRRAPRLVSVHSEHESDGIGVTDDLEVGADGFASWASSIVASQACSIAGATCGTITDGLGTAVSCGTCGTGDVCQSNTCVCAPKACTGSFHCNQSTCSCELTCHTAAECCALGGGEWINGRCQ
jgi:hypothetical protein